MSTLHLLDLSSTFIYDQLQIEEALLRVDNRNWCIINAGSSPAIVMGISGKYEELIDEEKMRHQPIPVIRRFSGGGTVVIDEHTYFVTFICNTSFVDVSPFPQHMMKWTQQIYEPIFNEFALRENDYVIGEKKIGGNAQSIIKNRWLHHSSFLWDYSAERMSYLKIPKRAPAYRQERTHDDFLARIRSLWQGEPFFKQLTEQLNRQFSVVEVNVDDIRSIIHEPHRRATVFLHN